MITLLGILCVLYFILPVLHLIRTCCFGVFINDDDDDKAYYLFINMTKQRDKGVELN